MGYPKAGNLRAIVIPTCIAKKDAVLPFRIEILAMFAAVAAHLPQKSSSCNMAPASC
jgi:hypothetical protein